MVRISDVADPASAKRRRSNDGLGLI